MIIPIASNLVAVRRRIAGPGAVGRPYHKSWSDVCGRLLLLLLLRATIIGITSIVIAVVGIAWKQSSALSANAAALLVVVVVVVVAMLMLMLVLLVWLLNATAGAAVAVLSVEPPKLFLEGERRSRRAGRDSCRRCWCWRQRLLGQW